MSSVFQGDVRAKTDIELVVQVEGKLFAVSDEMIEGGKLTADDTLLEIDDVDYKVALTSAEASVASSMVDLEIERAAAATNTREW